jgi:hypothetical protein
MFCARHLFSSYTSLTKNETVSVGDKSALVVARRGSVIFQNQLMNGIRTVVLHGALYVPRLTTNLISLGMLQRDGASFHSVNDGLVVPMCQGTPAAYPPVTGQGRLNGCGSAKAGWVSSAGPARRHTVSDIYTTDHNRLPSVDCDAFGLTANVLGIKVWVIPLHYGWRRLVPYYTPQNPLPCQSRIRHCSGGGLCCF